MIIDKEGFMGKKPQKTREVSEAIAEASPTIDETEQQQSQPQTQPQATRKRGRPRKIIVKMESEAQPIEQATAQGSENSMEVNKEEQHEGTASTCMRITKQEGVSEDMQLPKGEPSKSRARRKSKPRKSC